MKRVDTRNVERWGPAVVADAALRMGRSLRGDARRAGGVTHVLFAFCDHYEPLWGKADRAHGLARVARWRDGWPTLARRYVDANGRHPRHSFFFPGEQYDADFLGPLEAMTRDGLGEVEVHLHHDGDTPEGLRRDLGKFLEQLVGHGLLSQPGGRPRYAFIHGNWCLANARKDRTRCGVDDELPILFETGCYADFTFPAAPDESQPRRVNQIYWPVGDLTQPRCYERGRRARVGERLDDRILMIEGPLALKLRMNRLPVRIENGNVTAHDPPTSRRVRTWIDQQIHVAGRPEWVFVKVHTHGAPDAQGEALVGPAGVALHDTLTSAYNDGRRYKLHYVSAREMFNVAIAAMDGKRGEPSDYFDHVLPPPPAAQQARSS